MSGSQPRPTPLPTWRRNGGRPRKQLGGQPARARVRRWIWATTSRPTDFIATLAIETSVHYLDLAPNLPSAPDPDAASLMLVRRVLDGLLGTALTGEWDDRAYALKGTGRVPVTAAERAAIGALADRLPLFG